VPDEARLPRTMGNWGDESHVNSVNSSNGGDREGPNTSKAKMAQINRRVRKISGMKPVPEWCFGWLTYPQFSRLRRSMNAAARRQCSSLFTHPRAFSRSRHRGSTKTPDFRRQLQRRGEKTAVIQTCVFPRVSLIRSARREPAWRARPSARVRAPSPTRREVLTLQQQKTSGG